MARNYNLENNKSRFYINIQPLVVVWKLYCHATKGPSMVAWSYSATPPLE
jgi:hypothetical protein